MSEVTGRTASVDRTTTETAVHVELSLDGQGDAAADTGLPFFDHMLQQLGKHPGWDLTVTCRGDLDVDAHHTVEDCGLAVGQALRDALGDRSGVRRPSAPARPLRGCARRAARRRAGPSPR